MQQDKTANTVVDILSFQNDHLKKTLNRGSNFTFTKLSEGDCEMFQ